MGRASHSLALHSGSLALALPRALMWANGAKNVTDVRLPEGPYSKPRALCGSIAAVFQITGVRSGPNTAAESSVQRVKDAGDDGPTHSALTGPPPAPSQASCRQLQWGLACTGQMQCHI